MRNREEFENWVTAKAKKANYQHMDYLLKRIGDDYATTWVDSAWMGWQAAKDDKNNDSLRKFDAWFLFDPKTNQIKMDIDTGQMAIFEEEKHAKAAKAQNKGTEYKHVTWYRTIEK